MKLPIVRRGSTGFWQAMTVATAIALWPPDSIDAAVAEIALSDLAKGSDIIIVARVVKVENGPAELKSTDPRMPALQVARALVIENWKGKSVREVRYIASPTQICDVASAQVGEQVVLFLEKRADSEMMNIAHVGRGRMELRVVGTKMYGALSSKVILPKGTPTLTETKKSQLTLPPAEPGKPAPSITYTYAIESVELDVLRRLVKSAGR
jgi:hypothetical protein